MDGCKKNNQLNQHRVWVQPLSSSRPLLYHHLLSAHASFFLFNFLTVSLLIVIALPQHLSTQIILQFHNLQHYKYTHLQQRAHTHSKNACTPDIAQSDGGFYSDGHVLGQWVTRRAAILSQGKQRRLVSVRPFSISSFHCSQPPLSSQLSLCTSPIVPLLLLCPALLSSSCCQKPTPPSPRPPPPHHSSSFSEEPVKQTVSCRGMISVQRTVGSSLWTADGTGHKVTTVIGSRTSYKGERLSFSPTTSIYT